MRQYKVLGKPTMRLITLLILPAVITEMPELSDTQSHRMRYQTQEPMQDQFVVLADKRPEYSVAYSSAVQLKLASRKRRYRIGDLMSLDTALINISNKPIFLRELRGLGFSARDNAGKEVDVVEYIQTSSSDVTADSFQLVQPGEMITDTVQILIGCNEQAFKNMELMLDAKDDMRNFDQNLFVSWGQGCLNTKRLGTYTFSGEQANEYVVVSSESGNMRTTVGSLRSNSLRIFVSK